MFFGIATSGGTLAYQDLAPTRDRADKLVDERLAAPFTADANDFIYQWDSSGDYDPSAGLERIEAALLAINSADDERNPPDTGITERAMKRVKSGHALPDPGKPGDARPRHHGPGQVLRTKATRISRRRTATGDVGMIPKSGNRFSDKITLKQRF